MFEIFSTIINFIMNSYAVSFFQYNYKILLTYSHISCEIFSRTIKNLYSLTNFQYNYKNL